MLKQIIILLLLFSLTSPTEAKSLRKRLKKVAGKIASVPGKVAGAAAKAAGASDKTVKAIETTVNLPNKMQVEGHTAVAQAATIIPNTTADFLTNPSKANERLNKRLHKTVKEAEQAFKDVRTDAALPFKKALEKFSEIYSKNTKTFMHAARISACSFTFCLSEAYRDHKMDQLKKEQNAKKRAYVRNVLSTLSVALKGQFRKDLEERIASLNYDITEYQLLLTDAKKHLETTQLLNDVLYSEVEARKELASMGIKANPPSGATASLVLDFEKDFSLSTKASDAQEQKKIFKELQVSLSELSTKKNIAPHILSNEFVRNLSLETLEGVFAYKKTEEERFKKVVRGFESNIQESQLEIAKNEEILRSL